MKEKVKESKRRIFNLYRCYLRFEGRGTALDTTPQPEVEASTLVAANHALADGRPHIFFANFIGSVARRVDVPSATDSVRVSVSAKRKCAPVLLPFLGDEKTIRGTVKGERLVSKLKPIERGAAVWLEERE